MKRMLAGVVIVALGLAAGCTSDPKTSTEAKDLQIQTQAAIADFKQTDPDMSKFFTQSYAYAVFPDVANGAVGVGGAYGKGEVYEQGRLVGYAALKQANIGLQLGGQSYAELVFFKDAGTFADFRAGQTSFDARANAIAASKGAAATADYERGVAVFTRPKSGLMAAAAIGGQKFVFTPLENSRATTNPR